MSAPSVPRMFEATTSPLALVSSLLAGLARIRLATSCAVCSEPTTAAGLAVVTRPSLSMDSDAKCSGNGWPRVTVCDCGSNVDRLPVTFSLSR